MTIIAHIITGLKVGGAEMMLHRLIRSELSSKHQHIVLALDPVGEMAERFSAVGISLFTFDFRRAPFREMRRLIGFIRDYKPEIVQTWMIHSDFLGGIAARLAGVPHVIWGVHTTDYTVESQSTRVVRWLCARLSSIIPSKIVCVAQASLNASVHAGYCKNRLMVIPNGFDVEALRRSLGLGKALRAQIGIAPNALVIGCLGRYNPAKDHANFVQAAGRLAAKHPTCRFLMVGRGLDAANLELQEQIAATNFPDSFVLLGERSDPATCLDAMDVFVLSSRTEAFPMVLGEAMAMGVPCVSTDVGDAAILLGETGELVPSCNSTALAGAIERLMGKPLAERKELGQKGRERLEKFFSIEAAARRFDDLYSTLAKKR